MRAKFVRNKPAERKVREEGGGWGGSGIEAEIHSRVARGEGSGEEGCSPEANGGDHGWAKKKCQEEEQPDTYVLILIEKSTFISKNVTILHHNIYTVAFVYFIICSKRSWCYNPQPKVALSVHPPSHSLRSVTANMISKPFLGRTVTLTGENVFFFFLSSSDRSCTCCSDTWTDSWLNTGPCALCHRGKYQNESVLFSWNQSATCISKLN